MSNKKLHFETLQLHVGQEQADPTTDSRAVPIYQTTSYVFRNSQHAADRFALRDSGNIYGRLTNSTQGVFEDRVAALEGGVAGLAVASGAAAITYALQNVARNGDHIIAADNLYGGTYNLVEHTLKMARVTQVTGILNSTTNFILEELEKGCDMDDIMARGRAMGFIEADPAMDIEGYDAAGKITALLNVLMDAGITPDQVERKGIEDITVEDIADAKARGKVIKLLCRGRRDEQGNVIATVGPEEIPRDHMLASMNSTTSVVSITTDLMKTVSVVEHEPEIMQTAYGVFSDMLRVMELEG